LVVDSLSTPTNITKLVTTSENGLAISVGKKELSLELEKKIYSITKGASTSAYFNYQYLNLMIVFYLLYH